MKCSNITKNRMHRQRRHAFTLVEMLLVLTILAILAGLVLPKMVGQGEKAKIKATQAQIGGFKNPLQLFEVDKSHFSKGKNGLNELVGKPPDASAEWHQYLESIPLDQWQHPSNYEFPGR